MTYAPTLASGSGRARNVLDRLFTPLSPADWRALAVFLVGWFGYRYYADRAALDWGAKARSSAPGPRRARAVAVVAG